MLTVQAQTQKEHTLFRITITDTGIGIAQKDLARVFDRFMQVDSQYHRRFQGTGLGLAIVKSLVEAMHGKIGVESDLGKGSSFWFTLPLKPCTDKIEPGPTNIQPEPTPVVFHRPYTPKILVVEDNKLNQKVIKIMLQEAGCQVELANSGEQGLDLFKKLPFHLIFMDVELPGGMNGLETTQVIRKSKNKHNRLPIVALTAHTGEEDFENCIQAGADNVLTKPIMRQTLIKILDQYCPLVSGLAF